MKYKMRYFFGILFPILLILLNTCPNDSDYMKWLQEEHQITCINDGINNDCRKR